MSEISYDAGRESAEEDILTELAQFIGRRLWCEFPIVEERERLLKQIVKTLRESARGKER